MDLPLFDVAFACPDSDVSFICRRSNGLASLERGGSISRKYITGVPLFKLSDPVTLRRISSSFWRCECARISFPFVVKIENIVRIFALPKYIGDSKTSEEDVPELNDHHVSSSPSR